jgi:serine/threonine protein kinase
MSPDYPARIGHYDVFGAIGAGRLGTVYGAYDQAHTRLVTILVLAPDLLADARRLEVFRRGLKLSAALAHENVLRVLDEGQDGDLVYVVSEFMDGSALFERMKRSPLTLAEAIHVLRNVADGLGAAHRAGLVHGNLNPGNVFVSSDLSVAKVGEFGAADCSPAEETTRTTDLARARLLSALYRAPELAGDVGRATVCSDIYSLGVIAYELMTGKLPTGKFGLPSDLNNQVPLELDPIVLKCLASDPAQRYQSVGALRADFEKVAAVVDDRLLHELKRLSGGRLFAAKGSERAARRHGSRSPWRVGLAAVVLVVVAAAGALLLRERDEKLPSTDAPARTAAPQPASAPSPPPASSPWMPGSSPSPQPAAPPSGVDAAAAPPAAPPPVKPSTEPPAAPASRPPAQQAAVPVTKPAAEPPAKPAASMPRKPAPAVPGAPDLAAVAGALFAEAQLLVRQHQDIGAREKLAMIGEQYWQTPWFVPAMMAKIDIEDRRELRELDPVLGREVPASIPTKRLLTQRAPQHAAAEGAWWQLGESYDRLKQYTLAVQAYVELATRFPGTRLDAWFRAGEISERRLKNKEEARAAYLKVPSTSARYREAQDRARKLAGR